MVIVGSSWAKADAGVPCATPGGTTPKTLNDRPTTAAMAASASFLTRDMAGNARQLFRVRQATPTLGGSPAGQSSLQSRSRELGEVLGERGDDPSAGRVSQPRRAPPSAPRARCPHRGRGPRGPA